MSMAAQAEKCSSVPIRQSARLAVPVAGRSNRDLVRRTRHAQARSLRRATASQRRCGLTLCEHTPSLLVGASSDLGAKIQVASSGELQSERGTSIQSLASRARPPATPTGNAGRMHHARPCSPQHLLTLSWLVKRLGEWLYCHHVPVTSMPPPPICYASHDALTTTPGPRCDSRHGATRTP